MFDNFTNTHITSGNRPMKRCKQEFCLNRDAGCNNGAQCCICICNRKYKNPVYDPNVDRCVKSLSITPTTYPNGTTTVSTVAIKETTSPSPNKSSTSKMTRNSSEMVSTKTLRNRSDAPDNGIMKAKYTGLVIGLVVAFLILLIICIGVIIFCARRRRQRLKLSSLQSAHTYYYPKNEKKISSKGDSSNGKIDAPSSKLTDEEYYSYSYNDMPVQNSTPICTMDNPNYPPLKHDQDKCDRSEEEAPVYTLLEQDNNKEPYQSHRNSSNPYSYVDCEKQRVKFKKERDQDNKKHEYFELEEERQNDATSSSKDEKDVYSIADREKKSCLDNQVDTKEDSDTEKHPEYFELEKGHENDTESSSGATKDNIYVVPGSQCQKDALSPKPEHYKELLYADKPDYFQKLKQ